MKKLKITTFGILVIQLLLVTSSIGAVNYHIDSIQKEYISDNIEIMQEFSSPDISNDNQLINIHVKESNQYTSITGEPILPISIQTYEFPLGTKITDIKCSTLDINSFYLTKKITNELVKGHA